MFLLVTRNFFNNINIKEVYTPFPVHGLDDAMGLKRTTLGYLIGAMGMTGALFGFGLQTWIHLIEYPMNISGKPFFAYPAYAIITFELMVLFSAFGAVFGLAGAGISGCILWLCNL